MLVRISFKFFSWFCQILYRRIPPLVTSQNFSSGWNCVLRSELKLKKWLIISATFLEDFFSPLHFIFIAKELFHYSQYHLSWNKLIDPILLKLKNILMISNFVWKKKTLQINLLNKRANNCPKMSQILSNKQISLLRTIPIISEICLRNKYFPFYFHLIFERTVHCVESKPASRVTMS